MRLRRRRNHGRSFCRKSRRRNPNTITAVRPSGLQRTWRGTPRRTVLFRRIRWAPLCSLIRIYHCAHRIVSLVAHNVLLTIRATCHVLYRRNHLVTTFAFKRSMKLLTLIRSCESCMDSFDYSWRSERRFCACAHRTRISRVASLSLFRHLWISSLVICLMGDRNGERKSTMKRRDKRVDHESREKFREISICRNIYLTFKCASLKRDKSEHFRARIFWKKKWHFYLFVTLNDIFFEAMSFDQWIRKCAATQLALSISYIIIDMYIARLFHLAHISRL